MNRKGHEQVKFFIGGEVEKTPAFSKRTLFVVGKQRLDEIEHLARENRTPHIFLGANHSFNADSSDPYWDTVITSLLDQGFWVTLDYPSYQHEQVLKMLNPGIWQCRTFVPLLSVRIPKVQTSHANLTIKIDDIDFAATNAGVWCLHYHELTDSNRFTDWIEYETDEILKVNHIEEKKDSVSIPESNSVVANAKEIISTIDSVSESPVVVVEELNDQNAGLDLKTDTSELFAESSSTVEIDPAEAYAAGTTEDPLSGKGVKKAKAKK